MSLNYYGKETIDTNTFGKSTGRSGNYSTNYQNTGRELMTPDEVRLLDNRFAILFIRGERPVIDFKYDILKHKNVIDTTDGKGKPYLHSNLTNSVATISLLDSSTEFELQEYKEEIKETDYEIISEEDIENYLKEVSQNENK